MSNRFSKIIWPLAALALTLVIGGVLRLDSVHPAQARTAGTGRDHRLDEPVAGRRALRAAAGGVAAARPVWVTAARTPEQAGNWRTTWAAAPQGPVPGNLSAAGFRNQTIREIVVASAGGFMVRVRLTNAFGTRPVRLGPASVAIERSGPVLTPGTVRPLTFAGQPWVVIPPGAAAVSDPVRLAVPPLAHLVVSLYAPAATGPATEHVLARQVNYVAAGDRFADVWGRGFGTRTPSWYFLAGVDVLAPLRDVGTVVTFGDSITDGMGSAVDANLRWPNDLARRFAGLRGRTMSVADEGIAGNRVLNNSECCGVNGVARFQRDALGQPGVRDVILLEGINDIGFSQSHKADNLPHTSVSALQIIDGYEQMIAMARMAGVRIFGATLLPFRGSPYWTPAGEAKREEVNHWIRTSGAFAGVIDFARVVADPGHPERLNPAYDSGDHLHPNAAGYRAMAGAVDLAALLPRG